MKKVFAIFSVLLFLFAVIYGVGLAMDDGILHEFSKFVDDYMIIISSIALVCAAVGIFIGGNNISKASIAFLVIGFILPLLYRLFYPNVFGLGTISNFNPSKYISDLLSSPFLVSLSLLFGFTFKTLIYTLVIIFLLFSIFFISLRTVVTNSISRFLKLLLFLFEGIYVISFVAIVVISKLDYSSLEFLPDVLLGATRISSVMIYFLLSSFLLSNIGFDEVQEESPIINNN